MGAWVPEVQYEGMDRGMREHKSGPLIQKAVPIWILISMCWSMGNTYNYTRIWSTRMHSEPGKALPPTHANNHSSSAYLSFEIIRKKN